MHDLTAKRTLVKSPPELWSELSEIERLAKHLDAFGEITITKLEPEHTVAWEGEGASGTVSIEASGWGTKVTLTAQLEGEEPEVQEVVEEPLVEEPEVDPPAEVEQPRKRGFLAWLFRPRTSTQMETPEPDLEEPPVAEEPVAEEPVAEEPPVVEEPVEAPVGGEDGSAPLDPGHAQAILDEALDALGAAHHRPFSRG